MGFSKQEYWHELPCSLPGDFPHPGIKPASLTSPALAGDILPLVPPGKPPQREGGYYLWWGFSSCWRILRKLSRERETCSGSDALSATGLGKTQVTLVVKNPPANAGNVKIAGSILGGEDPLEEGTGNPLQYSCLENPHRQRTLVNTAHRVPKSRRTEAT